MNPRFWEPARQKPRDRDVKDTRDGRDLKDTDDDAESGN